MKRATKWLQNSLDMAIRWRIRHQVRLEVEIQLQEVMVELERTRTQIRVEIIGLHDDISRLKDSVRRIYEP